MLVVHVSGSVHTSFFVSSCHNVFFLKVCGNSVLFPEPSDFMVCAVSFDFVYSKFLSRTMLFNSKYYHNTVSPSIYVKPITTNSKINKKQNRNER